MSSLFLTEQLFTLLNRIWRHCPLKYLHFDNFINVSTISRIRNEYLACSDTSQNKKKPFPQINITSALIGIRIFLATFKLLCFSCLQPQKIQKNANWVSHQATTHFLKGFLVNLYFREREGRGRETETSMFKRNTDWLPLTCTQPGIWPVTHACALESNRRPFSLQYDTQPLNHASQGQPHIFFW